MPETYVHIAPGEPVESIGGHYVVEKEARMPLDGREVLVVFGTAVINKSCCGEGGCRFAQVPGFIVNWKTASSPDGTDVSEVEPVEDAAARGKIQAIIDRAEPYCQINFL